MNKINQALHDELLAMRERDQEVRKTLVEKYGRNLHWSADDLAWMESVDHANTMRMKEIIAHYGWPGYSLVGEEGEHTAWLLVQHTNGDLPFQKQCLALLTAAVEAGDASARNIAYYGLRRMMVRPFSAQMPPLSGWPAPRHGWTPVPLSI